MSAAFVRTLRRDYVANADLGSAAAVQARLDAWFADYNAIAPIRRSGSNRRGSIGRCSGA
jgi:hypothetical protein